MTPRDWTPEYRRYLAAIEVIQELERIPGVRRVSIGGRLRGGAYVPEMCFHVYVEAKRPESALAAHEVVPRTIRGFATDVLTEGATPVEMRGPNGQDDTENYAIKVGGIRFQESRNHGEGTIGCFARRNSDDQPVALTNFHIFFPNKTDQALSDAVLQNAVDLLKIKVGQPKHVRALCCTCNQIGQLVRVKKRPIDAAIILLDPDVTFYDKIKRIPTPYDGTPTLNGVITGTADAVPNNAVWKVGSVTGLTRGYVFEANQGQDIIIFFSNTLPMFIAEGDSGSVVVDTLTSKVVGLLKSGTNDWSQGIANAHATPIRPVLDALDIHIDGDPTLTTVNVAEDVDELFHLPAQSPFAAIEERIRASRLAPLVRALSTTHGDELVELVSESRPGLVAWHRAQGPGYFAAVARSAKEPAYRIPDAIAGVTRAEAVARLRDMLDAQGSSALRALVQRHGDELQELLVRHDTLAAMIDAYDRQVLAVCDANPPF